MWLCKGVSVVEQPRSIPVQCIKSATIPRWYHGSCRITTVKVLLTLRPWVCQLFFLQYHFRCSLSFFSNPPLLIFFAFIFFVAQISQSLLLLLLLPRETDKNMKFYYASLDEGGTESILRSRDFVKFISIFLFTSLFHFKIIKNLLKWIFLFLKWLTMEYTRFRQNIIRK